MRGHRDGAVHMLPFDTFRFHSIRTSINSKSWQSEGCGHLILSQHVQGAREVMCYDPGMPTAAPTDGVSGALDNPAGRGHAWEKGKV
jgi:hypothetical protein